MAYRFQKVQIIEGEAPLPALFRQQKDANDFLVSHDGNHAFNAIGGDLLLLLFPHPLIPGGLPEVLEDQRHPFLSHPLGKGAAALEEDVSGIHGAVAVMDPESTAAWIFHGHIGPPDPYPLLQSLCQSRKDLLQFKSFGNIHAEAFQNPPLHHFVFEEEVVENPLHQCIKENDTQGEGYCNDQSAEGCQSLERALDEFFVGGDELGEKDGHECGGHNIGRAPGGQESKVEKPPAVQGIEDEDGIKDAGQNIKGSGTHPGNEIGQIPQKKDDHPCDDGIQTPVIELVLLNLPGNYPQHAENHSQGEDCGNHNGPAHGIGEEGISSLIKAY